jgi:hypothetical protein
MRTVCGMVVKEPRTPGTSLAEPIRAGTWEQFFNGDPKQFYHPLPDGSLVLFYVKMVDDDYEPKRTD